MGIIIGFITAGISKTAIVAGCGSWGFADNLTVRNLCNAL